MQQEQRKQIINISIKLIWVIVTLMIIMTYYVNHYMPRGEFFYTGDVVCMNDGRGPCGEERIEDSRYLDIPNWAKFLRSPESQLLLFGLIALGIILPQYINPSEEQR